MWILFYINQLKYKVGTISKKFRGIFSFMRSFKYATIFEISVSLIQLPQWLYDNVTIQYKKNNNKQNKKEHTPAEPDSVKTEDNESEVSLGYTVSSVPTLTT